MRRSIDWIVLIAIIAVGGYLAYSHPQQVKHLLRLARNTVAPCSSPLTYSIGSIDPGFGISTSTLIADLKEAEDAWEKRSGKNLFAYAVQGGEVTVSLRYDERQAATDQLEILGVKIDESKATYDALRSKYDSLSATVKTERAAYEREVAAYQKEEEAYEAEVQKWNSRGGAPPAEYAKLNAQKRDLQAQVAEIKRDEQQLNQNIDTLNALATTLNQLIAHLNLNVAAYNQTGAESGEFEEGLYEVSSGSATITIYEFSNHTKLVRVLAHEMGHALGMDHVVDSQAIMYQINKGTALAATDADIEELNRVCRVQ